MAKTNLTIGGLEEALNQVLQGTNKLKTNRIKSSELATVLNISRHKTVSILKKLECARIVKQIKVGNKTASIWEIKSELNKEVVVNQQLPPIFLNKQYVTRQELFQLIDQLYAELNEIKTQILIANQSLEVIRTYWQRVYGLDTNRLGTAFVKSKESLCT